MHVSNMAGRLAMTFALAPCLALASPHTLAIADTGALAAGSIETFGQEKADGGPMFLDSNGNAVENNSYMYTGSPICPIHSVTYGSTELQKDVDYTVSYLNNKDAPDKLDGNGTARSSRAIAIVHGKGAYSGKLASVVPFSIRKHSLGNPDDISIDALGAQLPEAEPKVTVRSKHNGDVLVEGRDYVLSYRGNAVAGSKATVTVTALPGAESKCAGMAEIGFDVYESCLSIDAIADVEWTGKASTPDVNVNHMLSAGGDVIVEKLSPDDFEVQYRNNTAPGVATVKVVGTGKYKGLSTTREFRIVDPEVPISKAKVTVHSNAVYSGSAQSPKISIAYEGKELVAGKDYTVSCKDNVDAGTASAIIKGKGRFSGSRTEQFTIAPADISKASAKVPAQQYAGGAPIKPSFSLAYGKFKLDKSNYRVSYANNRKPGTGKIVVEGRGNFKGQKTIAFKIGKRSLSDAKIAKIANRYTDGMTAIRPPAVVTLDGRKLSSKTDFKVSYINNRKPGTAQLVIKARKGGGYAGSKKIKFKLVNIGDDVAKTACRLSYSRPKGNSNGTPLYRSKRGRADCGMGMEVAFRVSGHYKNLWHRGKSGWKFVCNFKPGKSPSKQGMLPGDLLVKESNGGFHTLMYVGTKIPQEIYKKKLKGTVADIGKPKSGSNFCSAHYSYDRGAGLCICDKDWGLATSSCKVYRLVHDKKSHRVGKKVPGSKGK